MTTKEDRHFNDFVRVLIVIVLLIGQLLTQAQELAFPEAEGFGKYATGGRGGQVIKVTNLNDEGQGSLREAIKMEGPRIIVFEVSGTIYLKSRLKINNGDVTIAGQTAPGHGITLAHYNFYVGSENVIIRHIRSRLSAAAWQQDDAFNCLGSNNVIVDHCSFSWSVDEVASIYHNKSVTIQNCIIAESFHNSIHEKGGHGYGGIWGGDSISFHHNLIMHNTSRNPRFHGARWYSNWEEYVDFRNNVIYNWASNSVYGGEPSEIDGSPVHINIVNNYYKYGPATNDGVKSRILDPDSDGIYGYGRFYVNGNYVYGFPEVTADNWLGVDNISSSVKDLIRSDTAFAYDITTIHTAEEAYDFVVQNVGVTIPARDTVDKRLIWELVNQKALYGGKYGANTGIVDNLDDVGGYPKLFTDWAPQDTDNDGIPDFWEIENGLDPNNPDDNHSILEGKTYPAIEEYVNGIVASTDVFMFNPTILMAKLTNIKEISLNWEDNTDEETAYLVWRSEGSEYNCIDTLPANTTFCTDTNIVFDRTYSYKVQAVNATDSSVYSNIAKATTLGADGRPKPAENPSPTHGANGVSSRLTLSWTPGVGANSHKVYLGTTNPPTFIGSTEELSFKVDNLKSNTRHYWRIDEVNENGETEGALWNFTTRNAFPEELIAHFSFNRPISVNDDSGNNIKGTGHDIRSVDFIDGVIGKALQFNGTTQYCEYTHNNKIDFDFNAFTISFWLKQDLNTTNKSNSHRYIVKGSNVKDAAVGHSGKRWEVYYTPDKSIFRFCVDDNVVKSEITADEKLFLKNDWVHVVAIRDTTSKKIKLYADTELVGEVDDKTGNIAQNEPMFMSYCVNELGFVDGVMDEVQLYGYALSDMEIKELYQNGGLTVKTNAVNNFKVYPNPSDGNIQIVNNTNTETRKLVLYNVLGKKLYEAGDNVLNQLNSEGQSNFNLKSLIDGNLQMYFLVISTISDTEVKKILVQ